MMESWAPGDETISLRHNEKVGKNNIDLLQKNRFLAKKSNHYSPSGQKVARLSAFFIFRAKRKYSAQMLVKSSLIRQPCPWRLSLIVKNRTTHF